MPVVREGNGLAREWQERNVCRDDPAHTVNDQIMFRLHLHCTTQLHPISVRVPDHAAVEPQAAPAMLEVPCPISVCSPIPRAYLRSWIAAGLGGRVHRFCQVLACKSDPIQCTLVDVELQVTSHIRGSGPHSAGRDDQEINSRSKRFTISCPMARV